MSDYLTKYGIRKSEVDFVNESDATTIEHIRGRMNWKGKLGFGITYGKYVYRLDRFYKSALSQKACYYGPFKGEFGHFLLHNLPFLMHLHARGVKINYCGMALHKPFLIDEQGQSLTDSFLELRDFFGEVKPSANQNEVPDDVKAVIETWKVEARESGLPVLEIDQPDFYWHGLRNWQLKGKQKRYDLSKVYGQNPTDSVVIFPRKKGGAVTPNNGKPWDYMQIARRLSPFFEKVYLVGHPSLSAQVNDEDNIEVKVSADNADTLKYCAEARLIVTQHSGAVHLGAYVNTPVLIIFKGDPPIKGLFDTLRFRKNLTSEPIRYAFNEAEVVEQAQAFSQNSVNV
jgi:hypothetical protein